MRYLIRELATKDIPAVIAQKKAIFGHSDAELLRFAAAVNPFMHFFVLDIDGEVSGYIDVSVADNADIHDFYVIPQYRGMGFGKLLLAFVIDLCRLSHVPFLSLEVRKSNARAIGLYQKYGFKAACVRPLYYADGEDALLMVKEFEVSK